MPKEKKNILIKSLKGSGQEKPKTGGNVVSRGLVRVEDTKKQEELRDIVAQLEAHKGQLDALSRQAQLIDSAILEIQTTIQAMNSLKESKVGTEILVALGSDSFVRAKLEDTEKVLTGVGASISVEKKVDDAIETLKSRGDDLSKTLEKLQKTALEVNTRAASLNSIAEKLLAEIQAKK